MQYHHLVAVSYVLDTDVIVAALRSDRGASRQLLLAALNREFELLLSVPLMLEYEAVLEAHASGTRRCGTSMSASEQLAALAGAQEHPPA